MKLSPRGVNINSSNHLFFYSVYSIIIKRKEQEGLLKELDQNKFIARVSTEQRLKKLKRTEEKQLCHWKKEQMNWLFRQCHQHQEEAKTSCYIHILKFRCTFHHQTQSCDDHLFKTKVVIKKVNNIFDAGMNRTLHQYQLAVHFQHEKTVSLIALQPLSKKDKIQSFPDLNCVKLEVDAMLNEMITLSEGNEKQHVKDTMCHLGKELPFVSNRFKAVTVMVTCKQRKWTFVFLQKFLVIKSYLMSNALEPIAVPCAIKKLSDFNEIMDVKNQK